jgi:hypothetical protein
MKKLILSLIAVGAVLLPLSQKTEAHPVYYYHPYWHHRYWHHGYWFGGFWRTGYWGYYGAPTIIIEY